MKNTLIFILAVFLLAGCRKEIKEGYIYSKHYKPDDTVMIMHPIVISTGKTAYTSLIPTYYYYPERWCISIYADNEKGERKTETWWVSESFYKRAKIGDWFSADDRQTTKEPRTEIDKPKQ